MRKEPKRKRSIRVYTRMDENEYELFQRKLLLSGQGTQQYIRSMALTGEVRAVISADFAKLTREINAIGSNINQVAHVANIAQSVSEEKIEKLLDSLDDVLRAISSLHEPVD